MRVLVFDTEYRWAAGLSRKDNEGIDRVPHPPNATIEAIGFVSITSTDSMVEPPTVRIGTIKGATERDRVATFIRAWSKTKPSLVTFSGRIADVPLLFARCIRYGLVVPQFTTGVAHGNRYRGDAHFDMHDLLGNYGAQRFGGMDDWARCIGWPGKGDVSGGDVAALLDGGKADVVDAYVLSDAVQEAAIWLRYCLASGGSSEVEFQAIAIELLRACDADPRVAEVSKRVDRKLFLSCDTTIEGAA